MYPLLFLYIDIRNEIKPHEKNLRKKEIRGKKRRMDGEREYVEIRKKVEETSHRI